MTSQQTALSLAPMEGVAGYIYRNAFASCFPGSGKFYSPFLSPGPQKGLSKREMRDILPENNAGICLVPQLLTKSAADFIKTEYLLKELGYGEVNLNLGCPSGTVVAKGKGSAFLCDPYDLDDFFAEIFREPVLKISVKTRIGFLSPEEFPDLLSVFNRYPLEELIIHPRVRTDFYRNEVKLSVFQYAALNSRNPLCYNGDIRTAADYMKIKKQFPALRHVMTGRGLISDPCLMEEIRAEEQRSEQTKVPDTPLNKNSRDPSPEKRKKISAFHECLLSGYLREYAEPHNVTEKMKEIWSYLIFSFPGSEKTYKKLMKADCLSDLRKYADAILNGYRLS